MDKKPVVLTILDGWGYSESAVGNPITQAKTPNLDIITENYPMTLLQASGLAVGMVWGETGNSEVGHLSIGSGRVVEQYYSRINRSIQDKSLFSNPSLVKTFEHVKQNQSHLHLVGLLTSGTVHAAFPHIVSLLEAAKQHLVSQVYLHLFLDGRDSGLQEGMELISKLQAEIKILGLGTISTLVGREFGMDRDNNWDLTQKAYRLITLAEGESSPDMSAIQNYYQQGTSDAAMPPLVVDPNGRIQNNDAVIFFNFREDSIRQIVRAFTDPNFNHFERTPIENLAITTMTQYLDLPNIDVIFPPPEVSNCLNIVLSQNQKTQLHIAETDKYAHVTYFFNGLTDKPAPGETDVFIDSVKQVEANPEMSSAEIASRVVSDLESGTSDFIVINFANGDLLAHTGNFSAAIKGIEAVDTAIGSVMSKVVEKGGTMIITADHGNVESMIYKGTGDMETRHESNPVPFYLIAEKYRKSGDGKRPQINGILADVAPTVLEIMEILQPPEMTGNSLLSILQ